MNCFKYTAHHSCNLSCFTLAVFIVPEQYTFTWDLLIRMPFCTLLKGFNLLT